jgi:chemotaxis protein MotA
MGNVWNLAKTKRLAVSTAGSTRIHVDRAMVVGLVTGFTIIALAIAYGGSPASFVNVPSLLIVLGGTYSAVAICFSLEDVTNALRAVLGNLVGRRQDPGAAAVEGLGLAETARHHGVLRLQAELPGLAGRPFLHKSISLAVDGVSGSALESILVRDLQTTQQRHLQSVGVLRKAAEYAPAMGLIGTLIGLVQMLGNLHDPSAIGPSMAVALLTTFYGAVLANLVFSPLAAKLERNAADEALVNQIYLLSALSIGRQENPRRLEILLNSVLPPAQRIQYFD